MWRETVGTLTAMYRAHRLYVSAITKLEFSIRKTSDKCLKSRHLVHPGPRSNSIGTHAPKVRARLNLLH